MIQPRTQAPDYWGADFALTSSDIEQIYNHFLEVELPQTTQQIARVIIAHRVAQEVSDVERLLAGRAIYQPKSSYKKGDDLVFPSLKFAHGKVKGSRQGYNPQYGQFNVIAVEINKKVREFAADLGVDHPLNATDLDNITGSSPDDIEHLYQLYSGVVEKKVAQALETREEFILLGGKWFVKALMADVNVGHLHLAEAVLEMTSGGPLTTDEILVHLDLDPGVDEEVKRFSLDYAISQDPRFDEVAPPGEVAWFLNRLEPSAVRDAPEKLKYTSIPHDRALLSPQLLLLERELDDEWSDIRSAGGPQPVVFSLMFPHRWAGTIPLSSRIRPLFPAGRSPRHRIIFIDEFTGDEITGWVVHEKRYIYGLEEWYQENGIPVGGFVQLTPREDPGVVGLNFDRRRAQREWVRLAAVEENRITFDLKRRAVGCGYDDLMIVGTDVVAAIDALWRRVESQQRTIASLLAEIFPQMSKMNPQNTVHAKTLYSAINMLRRVPPGPLFAELVRHPAFQPVGDHYWRFESSRWQRGN